jgi:hypothetical protein
MTRLSDVNAYVHGRDCGMRGGPRMVPPCFMPEGRETWLSGYDDGQRAWRHSCEYRDIRTGILLCMLSAFIMIGSLVILVKAL